jgi:hypothetical protein
MKRMSKLFKSVVIDEFNVDIHYDESIGQDTYDALVKAMNEKGFKHTSNVPPAHAKLYSMRSHELQAHIDGLKNAGRHEEAVPAQRILDARTKGISERRDAARSKMQRFTMKSEALKVDANGQWNIEKNDAVKYAPSGRVNASGMPKGWTADPKTGTMHHSIHGMIHTTHNPEKGRYEIKHGGRSVGHAKDMSEAGAKIKSYAHSLLPDDTGSHNLNPMNVAKGDEHMDLTCSEEDKKDA